MDLAALAEVDTDNPTMEQVQELKDKLAAAAKQVHPLIQSWTWTDDAGAKMPAPTVEVLMSLRFEELAYLVSASMGDAQRKDDDRKNGS